MYAWKSKDLARSWEGDVRPVGAVVIPYIKALLCVKELQLQVYIDLLRLQTNKSEWARPAPIQVYQLTSWKRKLKGWKYPPLTVVGFKNSKRNQYLMKSPYGQ